MDYNGLNLHELTVYDLCADAECLRRLCPLGKEAYVQELQQHSELRWNSMLSLSEESGYEALEAAVERQFANEIAALFDE